jgi:hypothetical protein
MIGVAKYRAVLSVAVLSLFTTPSIHAATTFLYTGNSFTTSSSGLAGRSIGASVTFEDAVMTAGFTGDLYGDSVAAWSIQIVQMPSSLLNNGNSVNGQWPLWFHFENGAITDWQLLATPATASALQLFTTNDSSHLQLCPTCDYYHGPTTGDYALVSNQPGTWIVAQVPEPETYMMLLAGLGLVFLARRFNVRKSGGSGRSWSIGTA